MSPPPPARALFADYSSSVPAGPRRIARHSHHLQLFVLRDGQGRPHLEEAADFRADVLVQIEVQLLNTHCALSPRRPQASSLLAHTVCEAAEQRKRRHDTCDLIVLPTFIRHTVHHLDMLLFQFHIGPMNLRELTQALLASSSGNFVARAPIYQARLNATILASDANDYNPGGCSCGSGETRNCTPDDSLAKSVIANGCRQVEFVYHVTKTGPQSCRHCLLKPALQNGTYSAALLPTHSK